MPTGFRVMGASAGSGKTFSLVNAYLSCCLTSDQDFPFRKILALTFTNKAAQEMKDRVVVEIERLADGPEDSQHLSPLRKETGLDVEEIGVLSVPKVFAWWRVAVSAGDRFTHFAKVDDDTFVHVPNFMRVIYLARATSFWERLLS